MATVRSKATTVVVVTTVTVALAVTMRERRTSAGVERAHGRAAVEILGSKRVTVEHFPYDRVVGVGLGPSSLAFIRLSNSTSMALLTCDPHVTLAKEAGEEGGGEGGGEEGVWHEGGR